MGALSTIGLRINIYQRGGGGVPSTSLFGDISARASNYSHTLTDSYGFESMQVSLAVSLDEALDWLNNGLMRSVIVSGPDAETVWEGYLNTVSAQIGQKPVTLSLDGMANRVRCTYTTVLGTPGTTSSVSDTPSQLLYGIKDRIVPLDASDATAAAYRAAIVLANLAYPKSREATQAMTGAQGEITLTLSFAGWYGTLEWLVTSNSTTSTAVTTTQVGTLLAGYGNGFLSTSTVNIIASGISSPQKIEANTTYREAIEDRLRLGIGTYPVVWGVYENREFYVQRWAGETPDVVTYYERLGDSNIYTPSGGITLPWNVRPNAISQVSDLLDVASIAIAPDAAARKYVGRVTCTISGDQIGCELQPSEMDSVEVRLASLRG
jgi:hypothetical protein